MSAPHPHVSFRWAAGDGEYLEVSVQPELIRGQLRCRSIMVDAQGDQDVTGEILRTVPIRQLVHAAAARLGIGTNVTLPPKDFAKDGMTEQALRDIVVVADWCKATGRPPLGILEREYGIPRGKASRWLKRARAGRPGPVT